MNHSRDRRAPRATDQFPFDENTVGVAQERRKSEEQRIENLNAEERQLMLSEMPAPIHDIGPPDEQD